MTAGNWVNNVDLAFSQTGGRRSSASGCAAAGLGINPRGCFDAVRTGHPAGRECRSPLLGHRHLLADTPLPSSVNKMIRQPVVNFRERGQPLSNIVHDSYPSSKRLCSFALPKDALRWPLLGHSVSLGWRDQRTELGKSAGHGRLWRAGRSRRLACWRRPPALSSPAVPVTDSDSPPWGLPTDQGQRNRQVSWTATTGSSVGAGRIARAGLASASRRGPGGSVGREPVPTDESIQRFHPVSASAGRPL